MKWSLAPLFVIHMFVFGQSRENIVKMTLWRKGTLEEWTVDGSLYLNKEFKRGHVLLNGEKNMELLMRYDAYNDEIEYLDGHGNRKLLDKKKEIGAAMDSLIFQYIPYVDHGNDKWGFFNPLNQGGTILYLRYEKYIFYRAPEHGYESFKPPEFNLKKVYYLKRKDRPAVPLNDLSRKEVFAVLWEHYTELRTYAREHKLKIRTEQEVIQVLKYYDGLPKK